MPPPAVVKSKLIGFKVTPDEQERIDAVARRRGLNRSDFMRAVVERAIAAEALLERMTEDEPKGLTYAAQTVEDLVAVLGEEGGAPC